MARATFIVRRRWQGCIDEDTGHWVFGPWSTVSRHDDYHMAKAQLRRRDNEQMAVFYRRRNIAYVDPDTQRIVERTWVGDDRVPDHRDKLRGGLTIFRG